MSMDRALPLVGWMISCALGGVRSINSARKASEEPCSISVSPGSTFANSAGLATVALKSSDLPAPNSIRYVNELSPADTVDCIMPAPSPGVIAICSVVSPRVRATRTIPGSPINFACTVNSVLRSRVISPGNTFSSFTFAMAFD